MDTQSIYRPIDGPDTIRLLRLLKGTKNYEVDPISCELFEAPLPDGDDDEAYYEALSYTWGDASETGTIIIGHRPTTVTANLHKALGHLRQTDEDRILWVDALCINQGDHSERMHQVGKMGNIYKKAREVIIWLGIATEKIDLLLRGVQLLDQTMIRIPKPRTDDPVYLEIWLDAARRHLEKLKKMDLEVHEMRVQGLQELLARDWWRRIWVIQEAANAARARIQCSWRSVPTRTFALMPQLMGISPGPREEALLEVLPGPLRKHSWWHTDRSLETLLEKFQYSESKEECDQIYALLGISSETTVPGCPLQADYSLSTTRIVQNTVSFLAFGELVDLVTCPLPTWNLSNLRKAMPTLLPNLLAWALSYNKLPLTWKLLFNREQPLQVPTVSNPLPIRVGVWELRLPSWTSSRHNSPSLQLQQSEESADSSLLTPLEFVISAFQSLEGSAAVYLQCGLNCDDFDEMTGRAGCSRGSIEWPDLIRLLSGCQDVKLMPIDLDLLHPENSTQPINVGPVKVLVTLDRSILKDHGWRLLHLAIRMQCRHSIRMLLEYEEVDVNHAEASFTPLSLAASLGDDWLVRLLLTRSDLNTKSLDAAGLSPLERAFEGNWRSTAALLLAQEGCRRRYFPAE